MDEIFTITLSLLGVIILILFTYFGAKWLNKRVRFTGNGVVKVLERVNFGPDKALMIISIGEKCMMLGVTQEHIEKIADLEKSEIEMLLKEKNEHTKQSFSNLLVNALTAKKQSKGGDDFDKS